MPEEPLTISATANKIGIGIETIRYYQRIGLIDEPEKPSSGYRVYSEEIISRLRFIKRAKELGFSLSEISSLLELGDGKCKETKELASRKLKIINSKLIDLQSLANTLEGLIKCCENNQPHQDCPIINAITEK